VAGLVHSRLFRSNGKDSTEQAGISAVEKAVAEIIDKLIESEAAGTDVVVDELEDFYRPPNELKFLSQQCYDGMERTCDAKHFTYTGKVPDFVSRERSKAQSASTSLHSSSTQPAAVIAKKQSSVVPPSTVGQGQSSKRTSPTEGMSFITSIRRVGLILGLAQQIQISRARKR
jgi:hypothetical protein